MRDPSLSIPQILDLLAAGPSHIASSTINLTAAQLRSSPGPAEWSANEVLAHLRSCADVWGSAIAAMLEQDRPTIRAVNPRSWIKRTDYLTQEFHPSLQSFTEQRAGLLKVLESLKPGSWSRSATITGSGIPVERTVQHYAEWMATHERRHAEQIEQIVRALQNRKNDLKGGTDANGTSIHIGSDL